MEWEPEQPISKLPKNISSIFADEADFLYSNLKANMLEVALIPAPDPHFSSHMIRLTTNENPCWYKDMYHSIPHFRRDRCLRALDRIKNRQDRHFRISPYKYDCLMRGLILERMVEGYANQGVQIPPNETIRIYFNIDPIPF